MCKVHENITPERLPGKVGSTSSILDQARHASKKGNGVLAQKPASREIKGNLQIPIVHLAPEVEEGAKIPNIIVYCWNAQL